MVEESIRFGPFELNIGTGELWKTGMRIHLPPQPARLLCLLATHPGTVVRRDVIRQHLWGDGVFVDYELGVNYCLNRIRSALCDSARLGRYIETVPRLGYRFIAPVEKVTHTPPTVAVLPFENLNGDPALDYFADGVTDALITELGSISSLRVISRQTMLHFKGSTATLPDIAHELHAEAVVEGTALLAGENVRISAQLIQMEPERHVWAQAYECEIADILRVQRQVARAVAEGIHVALSPADVARLSTAHPVDPDVYEAYLKGRHCTAAWSEERLKKGLRHLSDAIARDPNYAPAHAALADCLGFIAYFGHAPLQEAFPKAKESASRALALDQRSSFAHAVMAWIQWIHEWDLAAFEKEIDRALQLDPSNTAARMARSEFFLTVRNDRETAYADAHLALRFDPLSLYTNTCAAWLYLFARDFDRALAQAERTLELHPGALHPYYVAGWAELSRGRGTEATAAFERAAGISRAGISLGYLGYAYARLGKPDDAWRLLDELFERQTHEFVPNKNFICIYAGLGENDHAFEWLERAYTERDPILFWLSVAPPIDPLRSDSRFDALMNRIPGHAGEAALSDR